MKHIDNMIASVWLRYWSNCWNHFGLSNKKTYHWIGKVRVMKLSEVKRPAETFSFTEESAYKAPRQARIRLGGTLKLVWEC